MRKLMIITITTIYILYLSIFIIKQTERGIIFQFGKVLRNNNKPIIYYPGLHFKIPFIETVKILDSRIQTLNIPTDSYLTKENKYLIVDFYLKWKIIDFSRYYTSTGGSNSYQVELLLKRKFSDRLRLEFVNLNIKDIITDYNGHLTIKLLNLLNKGSFLNKKLINKHHIFINRIPHKKNNINLSNINLNSMEALGIKIVDICIKKIALPNEVSKTIYQKMKFEKETKIYKYYLEGQEEAIKIRAIADKKVTEILAKAKYTASKLHSAGDAIVTKLFADIINKNHDFYIFIRSLFAYKNSFKNNNNIIILTPDINFFHYMKILNKQKIIH